MHSPLAREPSHRPLPRSPVTGAGPSPDGGPSEARRRRAAGVTSEIQARRWGPDLRVLFAMASSPTHTMTDLARSRASPDICTFVQKGRQHPPTVDRPTPIRPPFWTVNSTVHFSAPECGFACLACPRNRSAQKPSGLSQESLGTEHRIFPRAGEDPPQAPQKGTCRRALQSRKIRILDRPLPLGGRIGPGG